MMLYLANADVIHPKKDVESCGQSFKHFTLVNYDTRVIITCKLLIILNLKS